MIEKELSFNIGEKKFIAKFPNVGQLIDLESLKQALTNNRYGVMASSGVASMYYVLDIVDTIAFLQVCIPSVAKHYDIKNYTSMTPDEITELTTAYKTEIKPWFDRNMLELKGGKKDGGIATNEDADSE